MFLDFQEPEILIFAVPLAKNVSSSLKQQVSAKTWRALESLVLENRETTAITLGPGIKAVTSMAKNKAIPDMRVIVFP